MSNFSFRQILYYISAKGTTHVQYTSELHANRGPSVSKCALQTIMFLFSKIFGSHNQYVFKLYQEDLSVYMKMGAASFNFFLWMRRKFNLTYALLLQHLSTIPLSDQNINDDKYV